MMRTRNSRRSAARSLFAANLRPSRKPLCERCGSRVWVNFFGETADEYVRCAERLGGLTGVDALEMNISCPNVDAGGLEFGVDPDVAGRLVERVCGVIDRPLVVKLTPNVTDILPVARACVEGGGHALSLINTLKGMAIDIYSRKPVLGNVTGGLSGPAIKPVALYMVYEVSKIVDIPVIGCGGISTAADALEFIMAGATAVQTGTAGFSNPSAPVEILEGIEDFMTKKQITGIKEIIGAARQ